MDKHGQARLSSGEEIMGHLPTQERDWLQTLMPQNPLNTLNSLSLDPVTLDLARLLLGRQCSSSRHRRPVSVVGPREAQEHHLLIAKQLGSLLGAIGIPIVCGGKNGVMAAVSEGAAQAGGVVVGLLPEDDDSLANPHLTVALPTGLGISRNALVARAACAMVAIGGGLGTTSEMALALQWGTPVLATPDAPDVPGRQVHDGFPALAQALLKVLAG